MIISITATNEAGESLKLELSNPWTTGVIIESVDGLGPTKGTVNTNELATSDGSVYNSARQEQRNIVFHFQLLKDDKDGLIETTRQKVYRYFQVKKKVKIRVETDNRVCFTEGYVESNEPDIFQENEKQSVSIICPNSTWQAPSAEYNLNGIDSLFEFPFENDSLTDSTIVLGEIIYQIGTVFQYTGDVESGIVMNIHATDDVYNPRVFNVITNEAMVFSTSKLSQIIGEGVDHMIAGDTIVCSTVDGDPYVTFIRDGIEYNAIAMLPKVSPWLKVQAGSNAFGYGAESGVAAMAINIQTQVLFGGI